MIKPTGEGEGSDRKGIGISIVHTGMEGIRIMRSSMTKEQDPLQHHVLCKRVQPSLESTVSQLADLASSSQRRMTMVADSWHCGPRTLL